MPGEVAAGHAAFRERRIGRPARTLAAAVRWHYPEEDPMPGLLARIWRRLRGPCQWYVLWVFHAKFMIGVTGLVRDREGRVLLLRHCMWASGRQWGLPTGYTRKRERFEDTVVREVTEETGLA
jgi:NUDIX domain-containing protein